jgi:hypothetical protein
MIRMDLRADGARCRACGAPLADAPVIRRSFRLLRSGEWIGSRGEFVTLRCGCGERRRILWSVFMRPHREAA